MTLDQVAVNNLVQIVRIKGEDDTRLRLLELGFTPNTLIKVLKKAPWNDPMELLIRQYVLVISLSLASLVEVEEIT